MRDGDHYVINGAMQFITSGKIAGWAVVFAVTEPANPKRGITAFLVPTQTPGYRVSNVEHKLGQRASDTASLSFEDQPVPAALRIGEEGEGYRIALSSLEAGRIGTAAQSICVADAVRQLVLSAARLKDAGLPRLEQACMASGSLPKRQRPCVPPPSRPSVAAGNVSDFPVQRMYRDVRVCQIYEGTSDLQKLTIARGLHAA